jgi:DNA ligase-1
MFKPMLADNSHADEVIASLRYPLLASIKYDGIRATMQEDRLVSRTLKAIPNRHVQNKFAELPPNIDGEIMVGPPSAKDVFQQTTSIVMSHNEPAHEAKFYVFDMFDEKDDFDTRWVRARTETFGITDVIHINQVLIHSEKELLAYEERALEHGYEGLILRDPKGLYKQGRSTLKQGWLLKLKRFVDAEAKILGFYEEMENTNEAKTNLLGRTERSTKKEGMVGKGTLGGFDVIGINGQFKNVEFSVGSGLTAEQKKTFWTDRKRLAGKVLKYKYFPIGVKDKPRLPIFLGFRDKADI